MDSNIARSSPLGPSSNIATCSHLVPPNDCEELVRPKCPLLPPRCSPLCCSRRRSFLARLWKQSPPLGSNPCLLLAHTVPLSPTRLLICHGLWDISTWMALWHLKFEVPTPALILLVSLGQRGTRQNSLHTPPKFCWFQAPNASLICPPHSIPTVTC